MMRLSKVLSMGCKSVPAFASWYLAYFSFFYQYVARLCADKKASISQKILLFRFRQKTLDNFHVRKERIIKDQIL